MTRKKSKIKRRNGFRGLTTNQFERMQDKYGSNFLCGYMRSPRINESSTGDYVNGRCALVKDHDFICTRRL